MKKWCDIILPRKGLLDLIPGNIANPEFSPNLQNVELDEGVIRSRKGYILNSTADISAYSTGTIAVKKDSPTVIGIGTAWLAGIQANLAFTNLIQSEKSYRIKSVDSDTQLTLNDDFEGETTDQVLSVDTNYATVNNPTSICWDSGISRWWSLIYDSVWKIRKHKADVSKDTDYGLGASGHIDTPTGITYMDGRIWIAGTGSEHQYIQRYKADMSDIDIEYDMGDLTDVTTPQILDISNIGTTLYSFAGFWVEAYLRTEYSMLKHDATIIDYTEYSTPVTRGETGLANDGTYLYAAVRKLISGVEKDTICKLSPNTTTLEMDTLEQFDPDIVHDEGLETFIRGVGHDGTNIWSCRSDTGTVRITKYSATTTGETYTVSGNTDNLFTYRKWDDSEKLIWSTIPKGIVSYSTNAKDWYGLKAGMNTNYHVSFVAFMNYLFASNGYDDSWVWDGTDGTDGIATANGAGDGTTVIDNVRFGQANDYWNGCIMVMTSGTCDGEIKEILDWDLGTTTFTLTGTGFSAQIDTADTFYVVYTIDNPNKITAGVISHDGGLEHSMPKGQVLCHYQSRLWITDKDHPNILRCSGLFLQVDAGMSDTWDAEQQLQIAKDDAIKGGYSAGDIMYVFGERQSYVLTGGPAFETYRLIPLKRPVGLLSDRGAQIQENYAQYCGREGIFEILGREIRELTAGIKNFFSTIQQTKLYLQRWIQSSKTEFDTGSYTNTEILVDELGHIQLLPSIQRWETSEDFDGKVASANVGTADDCVSLLETTDEKGTKHDDSYTENIAPNVRPIGFRGDMVAGSREAIADGNDDTYVMFKADMNRAGYVVCNLRKLRDIRKIRIKYCLFHLRNPDTKTADFQIKTDRAYKIYGTTTAVGTVTTLIDTVKLTQADNYWNDGTLIMMSGPNAYQSRKITDFDQGTSTVTVSSAFPNVFTVGDKYYILKTDPVTQHSERIYVKGTVFRDTTIEIEDDTNYVTFCWSVATDTMRFKVYEVEIYEYVENIWYEPTTFFYDEGYIRLQKDTSVANPTWRNFKIQVYNPHSDCSYGLSARVSSNGDDWDSWQSFGKELEKVGDVVTYGGTPPVARKRHIQIQVLLKTDLIGVEGNHTPVLHWVSMQWLGVASSLYTSATKNLSDVITVWDVFDVKIEVPSGSSLKLEVTSAPNDANGADGLGGANYPWVEITPGTKPTGYLNPAGNTWFQWRVTLYSTNGETPLVKSVGIWWFEGGQQVTPICSVLHDHKYSLSCAIADEFGIATKYNNRILRINKERNFEIDAGLNISGFAEFRGRLYGGASNNGFIYLLNEEYSDNRKTIDAWVETVDYSFNKEFRKNLNNKYKNIFQFYCEGKVSYNTLRLGYSFDGGASWSEIEVGLNDLEPYEISGNIFKIRRYLPSGTQGKMMRFRPRAITASEPIEIHLLKVEVGTTNITGE